MNNISKSALEKANVEGILNIYCNIDHHGKTPKEGTKLSEIVNLLEKSKPDTWKNEIDKEQFYIFKNAVNNNEELANTKIGDSVNLKDGLKAYTFTNPEGKVSITFAGTGKGEWLDNGQGLSGVPQKNTYLNYKDGKVISENIVENDYATVQQVEALNWFNETATKNGWTEGTEIVISGHSKGGNKAQFITMHSNLVDDCYSFDGQGFSPEAIESFEKNLGKDYEKKRQKIQTFSSKDDYVNVWGKRLTPEDHIYFFEPSKGYDGDPQNLHQLHAMFDKNGKFTEQCEQGEISKLLEQVSDEIMKLPPEYRQCATLGAMGVAQKFLGKTEPINNEEVSTVVTCGGTVVVVEMLLEKLLTDKTGLEALNEIIKLYDEDVISATFNYFDEILGGENIWEARANAYITTAIVLILGTCIAYEIGLKTTHFMFLIKGMKLICNRVKSLTISSKSVIQTFFANVIRNVELLYYKKFSSGYSSASYNTLIKVDTDRMRYYAERLDNINLRLINIDIRIKKLYANTNLSVLLKIIRADTVVGYSNKLRKCSKYLKETANDFDAVERSVTKLF